MPVCVNTHLAGHAGAALEPPAIVVLVLPARPEHLATVGAGSGPFRVGLDRVARELEAAGVENTGAKLDEGLGEKYVAFRAPDRIAWEFYMA